MTVAENLLNTLESEVAPQNNDNDIEEPIIVDETRRIIVPNKLKTIAVTGDKDVETVTFRCIRYWDSVHDLSQFSITINYMLPDGTIGTYIPKAVETKEDFLKFDWVIGKEVTKHSGTLSFLIFATKTDSEGVLEYQWSSFVNSECKIAQGIDLGIPQDEQTFDYFAYILQYIKENYATIEYVDDKFQQSIPDIPRAEGVSF